MPKPRFLPQATLEDSNRSANPSIWEVAAQGEASRRQMLRGGLASLLGGLTGALATPLAQAADAGTGAGAGELAFAPPSAGPASAPATEAAKLGRRIGFTAVPMGVTQPLVVPVGYSARVLYRWGDAVGIAGRMPAFKGDGSHTAAEQALQAGMHHDGMGWFPLGEGKDAKDGKEGRGGPGESRHGLLAVNHEYTDEALLHADGMMSWSADKTAKSIAAHGVSVVEVRAEPPARPGEPPRWALVRPSRYARRITASTPMRLAGPAAGHPLMRTAADPEGRQVLGTYNNCAAGVTPWGTYLTCEENFYGYFEPPEQLDAHHVRWGLKPGGRWHRWHEFEERFDMRRHPNEFNRFGWVVEIDPYDPQSVPVKRSALGRATHEGATSALLRDGRVAVFMGEDARFEYIYRFVSRDPVRPGGAAANRDLLDNGTLSVARFDADGHGRWLPLVHGRGPLTRENGFADQGEVLIKARQASDALGGTKMDRPEWTAVDAATGQVYVTLTNNSARGRPGQPGPDAANPRGPNPMGHILRWKHHGDLGAETFDWELFALGGEAGGDAFGGPDGLMLDPRGVLWIATDHSPNAVPAQPGERLWLPRNQLLACDPSRAGGAQPRRFLVGPHGCEITGPVMTPDCRTLFINVQHPGVDPAVDGAAGDLWAGSWPEPGIRPCSATVVITKDDGGVIGT
ncbi:PhoX family protein [Sphaerotilus microaerophilus]|uniref:Tat pathway signal protein n=1 Tax=Sphaerotilus microaerophilus TaxID=2914710 RepID=A0ABM7YRT2_9BURK|nr:PhoX family phosphatase [Sphaerotilus sp. FB-5]BDI07301.1 Tat pathway signal protein [Sphaerotilus sp. FB-5]